MRYLESELAPRDDHRGRRSGRAMNARQKAVGGGFVTPDKPLRSPWDAVHAALKLRGFALADPSQD
jgi:hypothetical protein